MHDCSDFLKSKISKSREPYRVFLRPLRDKMRLTHRAIEQHLTKNKPLDKKKLLFDLFI